MSITTEFEKEDTFFSYSLEKEWENIYHYEAASYNARSIEKMFRHVPEDLIFPCWF